MLNSVDFCILGSLIQSFICPRWCGRSCKNKAMDWIIKKSMTAWWIVSWRHSRKKAALPFTVAMPQTYSELFLLMWLHLWVMRWFVGFSTKLFQPKLHIKCSRHHFSAGFCKMARSISKDGAIILIDNFNSEYHILISTVLGTQLREHYSLCPRSMWFFFLFLFSSLLQLFEACGAWKNVAISVLSYTLW